MRRSRRYEANVISVVLDTMIFVRALLNPLGLCGKILFQHKSSYSLYLSSPLAEEIREVIVRPELSKKFRRLTPAINAEFSRLLDTARLVQPPEIPPRSRDPKDDKVLALAQAADADYLVTDDQDLLVLQTHAGARIVAPAAFLHLLIEIAEDVKS